MELGGTSWHHHAGPPAALGLSGGLPDSTEGLLARGGRRQTVNMHSHTAN